jgi:hypothetical protein
MSIATSRLGRLLLAALGATVFTLAWPATATAQPEVCPKNTVTIGNQGKVINVPQHSQVCDDDPTGDGLLGDLPVLGNLPGLSGIL